MEDLIKYIVALTIAIIVYNIVSKLFSNLFDDLKDKLLEFKFKKQAEEYVDESMKKVKAEPVPVKYYGMFEFIIENCDDGENLKKDYFSVVQSQIKAKYKSVISNISATDKIFFSFNNFSKFDSLVEDLIKLYDFFGNVNKKRNIKTNLKFCIWTAPGEISTQEAYDKLCKLSNLNFVNQVIANQEIYKQYKKYNLKSFTFNPLGIVQAAESNEEIELYRLLKVSVAKSNNE